MHHISLHMLLAVCLVAFCAHTLYPLVLIMFCNIPPRSTVSCIASTYKPFACLICTYYIFACCLLASCFLVICFLALCLPAWCMHAPCFPTLQPSIILHTKLLPLSQFACLNNVWLFYLWLQLVRIAHKLYLLTSCLHALSLLRCITLLTCFVSVLDVFSFTCSHAHSSCIFYNIRENHMRINYLNTIHIWLPILLHYSATPNTWPWGLCSQLRGPTLVFGCSKYNAKECLTSKVGVCTTPSPSVCVCACVCVVCIYNLDRFYGLATSLW